MQSDEIRIEIVPGRRAGWWAYITQVAGPNPLEPGGSLNSISVTGNRRTVGRAFQTNPEAWQWAQEFVARLRRRNTREA
jgi:hypothetical protein